MTSSVWTVACVAAWAVAASAADIGVQSCALGTWAVTFDDGPCEFTPTVLKYLSDAGVNATFFVIGKQLENPTFVKNMQDAFAAGHQIASHTYTHANLSQLDEAAITKEVKDTEARIFASIGKVPSYLRPPFGDCDDKCAAVIKKLGYTPGLWNIDSRDWTHAPSGVGADQILQDITRYDDGQGPVAKPTDPQGVISLSHDIHGFGVDRLPKILAYIKQQGFKFATVAECANDGRPPAYRDDDTLTSNGRKPKATPSPNPSPNPSPTPAVAAITNDKVRAGGVVFRPKVLGSFVGPLAALLSYASGF